MNENNVGKLAVAMSSLERTGFDFVGRFQNQDEQYLYLEKPLVIDYDENRTVRSLAPLHLPYGLLDFKADNVLALPHNAVAYTVFLPDGISDWVHDEYNKFWSSV